MKALKVIGLVLIGLVVLFLVLGLIAPREISTERSLAINAPPERIFQAISDFSTWDEWSPWILNDTTTRITPGERMQGVGASYSWTGEQNGSGTQMITAAKSPWSVNTHIEFDGMGEADAQWGLEPTEDGTNVTWAFNSNMPYPWNTMLLFQDMSGDVGQDFEEGLNNLKAYIESGTSTAPAAFEIEPENNFSRYFLTHRAVVSFTDATKFYQDNIARLLADLKEAGIEPTGPPAGLYYVWDEAGETTDMAVAVPVPAGTTLKDYQPAEVTVPQALVIDYAGPYEGSAAAHYAMDAYLEQNGLKFTAPVLEEYVTGPLQTSNPKAYRTRVVYLLP